MEEFNATTLLIVFLCATLSGATGILGGAILLAYLLDSFTLSIAMIAHGTIQFSLNLFRAFFFRHFIRRSAVIPFVIGALVAFAIVASLPVAPSKAIAFLCLGAFGLFGCSNISIPGVGFDKPSEISTAGAAVSTATVMSGVGGPILDTFFAGSHLNRLEILGTKSVLQGFGHLLKVSYFLFASIEVTPLITSFNLLPLCVLAAFMGTFVGKCVAFKMTEGIFRRIQSSLIFITSLYFLKRALEQF